MDTHGIGKKPATVLGTVAALAAVALVVVALSLLLGDRGKGNPTEGDHPLTGISATGSPLQEAAVPVEGVAELLAEPPAAGETVEVDAYFSGAVPTYLPGPPRVLGDEVYCPTYSTWMVALTDRAFPPLLRVLNGTHSNKLPQGAAWLAATTPEGAQPGGMTVPDLPYRGRFRGHLGDPAFAGCPDPGRIFVVEEVVEVYEQEPPGEDVATSPLQEPENYVKWLHYDDAAYGYSLSYPPDWTVFPLLDEGSVAAVALRSPQWPDWPVTMRVYDRETWYDQYKPASIPPLLQGDAFGLFEQGWVSGGMTGTQGLAGYTVERSCQQDGADCRTVNALFSGNGHTYELSLTYPLGFEAPQALLAAYTTIVQGLRLDPPPGPTPAPPIKQPVTAPVDEQKEAPVERIGSKLSGPTMPESPSNPLRMSVAWAYRKIETPGTTLSISYAPCSRCSANAVAFHHRAQRVESLDRHVDPLVRPGQMHRQSPRRPPSPGPPDADARPATFSFSGGRRLGESSSPLVERGGRDLFGCAEFADRLPQRRNLRTRPCHNASLPEAKPETELESERTPVREPRSEPETPAIGSLRSARNMPPPSKLPPPSIMAVVALTLSRQFPASRTNCVGRLCCRASFRRSWRTQRIGIQSHACSALP